MRRITVFDCAGSQKAGFPFAWRVSSLIVGASVGLLLFEAEGVSVLLQTAETGGATVRGGQIPAFHSGAADLTVGGPIVTMKMLQDGEARLVSFCAVAVGNPWVLAAKPSPPQVAIGELAGERIIDVANVGTATSAFRWLLKKAGPARRAAPGAA